jgi:hypothetical protein
MAFFRNTELFIGTFKDSAFVRNAVKYKLGAQTLNGFLVDALDYDFQVTLSTEFYRNSASFTLYNASPETVNEIMTTGCAVIFKAGYEDEDLGTIFVGQIVSAYPEYEDAETSRLVINCKSQRGAQYPLQRTFISAYMEDGTSYHDVLKNIADYVGVPLTGAEALKDKKLENGFSLDGDIRSVLKKFQERCLRRIGGKLIVTNNEILYLDKENRMNASTVLLNYNTGLISATPVRNEKYQSSEDAFNENMDYYLGLKNQKSAESLKKEKEEAKVQPRNEVSFRALMVPSLHVGDPVYIDSRRDNEDKISVLGKFWVEELNYNGNNYGGDFNIEGKAAEYTW